MSALDDLHNAVPGLSTEKILKLGERILKEEGDLNGQMIYRLAMLATERRGQSAEVSAALGKMREDYFKEDKRRKKPRMDRSDSL